VTRQSTALASDERALAVSAATAPTRRQLGPVGWLVLEELALSVENTSALIAPAGVRRLGARLGLDKDTVARAVRRLSELGLLHRVSQCRLARGSFATGGYRIQLPEGMWLLASHPDWDTEPGLASSNSRLPCLQDGDAGNRASAPQAGRRTRPTPREPSGGARRSQPRGIAQRSEVRSQPSNQPTLFDANDSSRPRHESRQDQQP
jgi:hypothetical protein